MKKIVILVLFMIIGTLTGCVNGIVEPTVNELDVETVELLIETLPLEITLEDRAQVEDLRARFNALNGDEQKLVYNIDVLENAEITIAALDAEIAAIELVKSEKLAELKRVADILLAELPSVAFDNLTFKYFYATVLGNISISWASSDINTISQSGIVIPGHEDTIVRLTAYMNLGGVSNSFSKDILVKAIEFDPLPVGNTVFAYAFGLSHGFDERAKETIDVVNHAFALIKNGEVNMTAQDQNSRPGVLQLRKEGIRVLLCIGGYGDAAIPWSMAAYTEEGRVKLAKSIVDNVVKYNYDGVDVDWEYPGFYNPGNVYDWSITTAEDSANYTLLMKEIKKQLDEVNEDFILSAAVPGGPWATTRYEIANLTPVLDYFNLMTYDLDDQNRSTHLTGLYESSNTLHPVCTVDGTVNYYLSKAGEAIRNKLVVGAAFYVRQFKDSEGIGQTASSKSSIGYSKFKSDYLDKGYVEQWDDVAKAPYLVDEENNFVFSYDSPRSIKEKSKYITDNGLAGIMFWQYAQDSSGTLVNAIYEGLKLK